MSLNKDKSVFLMYIYFMFKFYKILSFSFDINYITIIISETNFISYWHL